MADRRDLIENVFTDLAEWGAIRDAVVTAVELEGFSDPNNVILSEFTPDHAIYPDLLADLLFKATNCHESIYALLKSQNSVHDVMVAANQVRDRLDGAGSFDSATGWSPGSGWSISGGVLSINVASATQNHTTFNQTFEGSTRYLFEFDITAYTRGEINPQTRGTVVVNGPQFMSTGHKQAVITSPANESHTLALAITGAGGFVGTVDNLVIRRLD